MGCGCRGNNNNNNFNQQRVRSNLQAARRPFVPPGQSANPNFAPAAQGSQSFMVQQARNFGPMPALPRQTPQQPVSAADRRRIQRLNEEAIRRSLGR